MRSGFSLGCRGLPSRDARRDVRVDLGFNPGMPRGGDRNALWELARFSRRQSWHLPTVIPLLARDSVANHFWAADTSVAPLDTKNPRRDNSMSDGVRQA